jgi:hypothetical protein
LHLQGLIVVGLGKRRGEGSAVGVHAPLLLRETVVGAIDCRGDWMVSRMIVGIDVWNLGELVVVLVWEDGVRMRGVDTRNAERGAWSSSMRDRCGSGTDAACAETRQKRGPGVGGWSGRHGLNRIRGE